MKKINHSEKAQLFQGIFILSIRISMGDKKPNFNANPNFPSEDSDIEEIGSFSPKLGTFQAPNAQLKYPHSEQAFFQQHFNQTNQPHKYNPEYLTQKHISRPFSEIVQNIQRKNEQPFGYSQPNPQLRSNAKLQSINSNFESNSNFLQMIQPKDKKMKFDQQNSTTQNFQSRVTLNNSLPIPLHPSITVPPFHRFSINKIEVRFPFPNPYPAQIDIMKTSIKAFLKGQNALLESPTGTGKSLALLASALAYQESHPQIVRIFYTSRTHMQLKQLVSEFKKLAYFPRFGILASRAHLCLIPGVYKSPNPNAACRDLCNSEDGCPYYKKPNTEGNRSDDIENIGFKPADVSKKTLYGKTTNTTNNVPIDFTSQGQNPKFDLDDLKEYGKKNHLCPYQLAFSIYQGCQLVLCPYNYIFKANDDNNLLCDLAKNTAIVIFDEGHNIEDTARESCSLTFSLHQIIDTLQDAESAPLESSYKTLFDHIRQITTDLQRFLKAKRMEYNNLPKDQRPKYLKAEFKDVFKHVNPREIWSIGTQMQNYVKYITTYGIEEKNEFFTETLLSFCEACQDIFSILRSDKFDAFRIVFVPDEFNHPERDQFRLLCMRPGVLFEPINVHALSVIIASGTLSPLDSFSSELEATFPFRISAQHVVDSSQALAMSIVSNNGVRITSKFSVLQADKNTVFDALGQVLIKTLPSVPGGALLFTPSYWVKNAIIKRWKQTKMFDEINRIKPIVEEISEKKAPQIFAQFKSYRFGALLIGVCRGKISEGIDFSDDLARIVYAYGIPYPGIKDPDIEQKMQYNNQRHSTNESYMSGNDWYTGQAFRALFQSIGRCLRHTNDYGAIVFLDDRIESNLDKLPVWLKDNISTGLTPEDAANKLQSFYMKMKAKFPNHKLTNFGNNSVDNELFEDEELDNFHNLKNQNVSPINKSINSSVTKFDQKPLNQQKIIKTLKQDYSSKMEPPFQKSSLQSNQYQTFNQNTSFQNSNKIVNDQKPFLSTDCSNSIDQKPFLHQNSNNPIDQNPYLFNETKSFNIKNQFAKQTVIDLDDEEDQFEDYVESNAAQEVKMEKQDDRFFTKLFCSNCLHPIITLRNLQNVDFIDLPINEFFQNIDIKKYNNHVMCVSMDNIVEKFTNSAEIISSSEKYKSKFLKESCASCGQQVATHILITEGKSLLKPYQTLLCKELLSMNYEGKLTPLKDI